MQKDDDKAPNDTQPKETQSEKEKELTASKKSADSFKYNKLNSLIEDTEPWERMVSLINKGRLCKRHSKKDKEAIFIGLNMSDIRNDGLLMEVTTLCDLGFVELGEDKKADGKDESGPEQEVFISCSFIKWMTEFVTESDDRISLNNMFDSFF